jgi:hypothetical protein
MLESNIPTSSSFNLWGDFVTCRQGPSFQIALLLLGGPTSQLFNNVLMITCSRFCSFLLFFPAKTCKKTLHSLDWFKEQFTGNPHL